MIRYSFAHAQPFSQRFFEHIFNKLEKEAYGKRNEAYLKKFTILDAAQFMVYAERFHARKFKENVGSKKDQDWARVKVQYEAASRLRKVYYVGKYFLGGERAR
jgi:hypothetical protein